MNSINAYTAVGRLTRDPEVIADGKGVKFDIALNRTFRTNGSDEWQEETTFVPCVAWRFVEMIRKAKKGDVVCVQGRIEQQSWQAEDGSKRTRLQIVAENVAGEFQYRRNDSPPEPELPAELMAAVTTEQTEPVAA